MGKRKELGVEEKVSLVEEYLAGRLRMREAARRAGVGHSTMENWISRYRSEGVSGLRENGNRAKRRYSEEIKRKAVEEYLSGHGSSMAIAEKYQLRSGNLVLDWVKAVSYTHLYRAIGAVCDKVILMAHDYQWTSVPEGYVGVRAPDSPVTPFPDVYRALTAITDPVTGVEDKSKIVLQISFAAAGFEVDANGLLSDTAIYRPAPETVAKRLAQAGTMVTYDESDRNSSALYTTEDGMTVRLWYEDARSVADKLTLARMMGITGVSVWRLGNVPAYREIPGYDAWAAILAQR